jgi:hypothetical protein
MTDEKLPLTGTNPENGFYTGQEVSGGDVGSTGISRRLLHGLTAISVLGASICTVYGSIQAGSVVLVLPFVIILIWLFIHLTLIFFAKNDQHNFQPPSWFIFISSGHIFMQAVVVMILTLYKKGT